MTQGEEVTEAGRVHTSEGICTAAVHAHAHVEPVVLSDTGVVVVVVVAVVTAPPSPSDIAPVAVFGSPAPSAVDNNSAMLFSPYQSARSNAT